MLKFLKNNFKISLILIEIIKIYQKIFSPNHGIFSNFYPPFFKCRFYPSCSEYFILALEKKGLAKGLFLGIKRILKCHPFNEGGIEKL